MDGTGDFAVDDALSLAALGDLSMELGVDSHGRVDETVSEAVSAGVTIAPWLEETDRGVDVVSGTGGEASALASFRGYWWGDDDDREQLEAPNFEVPSLGFKAWWYKYAWRESCANMPVDMDLVAKIRLALQPALEAAYDYVPHQEAVAVDWKPVYAETKTTADDDHHRQSAEWVAKPPVGAWSVGYVRLTGEGSARDDVCSTAGKWSVELQSRVDDHSFYVGSYRTQAEAFAWAELMARRVIDPAWKDSGSKSTSPLQTA